MCRHFLQGVVRTADPTLLQIRKLPSSMKEKDSNFTLNMAVPNGIILALIGVLVLITPLATEIRGDRLTMDLVAGAALVIGGGVSLVLGLKRRKQDS